MLDDNDDALLRFQIDMVCMELGEEVEGLLEVRVEKKDGKKTSMIPRFTLSELLEDDFELPVDLLRQTGAKQVYRDPRQAMMQGAETDISDSYEISVEDVL